MYTFIALKFPVSSSRASLLCPCPSSSRFLPIKRLRRPPVLRPHVVRHRLRLLVSMMVVVRVRVVGRSDVFHAVNAATLVAACDGAVAGHLFVGEGVVSQSVSRVSDGCTGNVKGWGMPETMKE